MQENVKLTPEQIKQAVQEIFPMFNSKEPGVPQIKQQGNITKISMLNLSPECMKGIVDLWTKHPDIYPWIKRSGYGIVVMFEDKQK